ncbi:hypothetical protein BD289DRAFT_160514 [Coniella lustricola]|uniref:Uncharacterized protein n=1 Tax=Coniella lustricola TaxID=2025994 RepID=A0A2T2ZUI6_9PEZI|nr:hypothetical protein BD289DRAFT_160514 [Coniella lustricola]
MSTFPTSASRRPCVVRAYKSVRGPSTGPPGSPPDSPPVRRRWCEAGVGAASCCKPSRQPKRPAVGVLYPGLLAESDRKPIDGRGRLTSKQASREQVARVEVNYSQYRSNQPGQVAARPRWGLGRGRASERAWMHSGIWSLGGNLCLEAC